MAFAYKFRGRMEKRLPIAIIVQLAPVHAQPINGPELSFTDNISAHGACVVSSRPWKLSETIAVTSLQDQITLRGKVAHCQKRSDQRYAVGLAFQGGPVTWSKYRTYSPGAA